jgi:prevent-host-death family protein
MRSKRVSATEASRSFSELVNRVRYAGEEFVVEKGGEPVCRIVPVAEKPALTLGDLARLVSGSGPDLELADAIEEAVARGNAPSTLPDDPWQR